MSNNMFKFQAKRTNPGFTVNVYVSADSIKVTGYGSGRSGEFFKTGNLLPTTKVNEMGGIAAASRHVKETIRQIYDAANGDAAKMLIALQQAFPENGNWQEVVAA